MVTGLGTTWVAGALLVVGLGVYTEAGAGDDDAWFFRDFEAEARAVNEGELELLAAPPAKKAHHHENRVTVREDSLVDGWVELRQCHENLDAVPVLEVVFNPRRTRDLRVLSADDIGSAVVEGPSVQLRDVGRSARLCIAAESRALHVDGDGTFVLRNGPFMRRFLDGYYPMRVQMRVDYPCGLLELVTSSPAPQPGFRVERGECGAGYDTWFEGRLRTELVFRRPGET